MIASLRRLPAGAALLERLGLSTRVHLVGGAVRDLLLEREPPDLDLVLEGDALGLALRIDPDARRHGRFGTATFMVNGLPGGDDDRPPSTGLAYARGKGLRLAKIFTCAAASVNTSG